MTAALPAPIGAPPFERTSESQDAVPVASRTSKPSARKSRRGWVLPLAAVVSLGYSTWHVTKSIPAMPQTEPLVDPPRTPFSRSIAGAGLVEPQSECIQVAAFTPGAVVEVAVQAGQAVAEGDLLFRLDDRQRRAELAVTEAKLAEASAELARWQALPRAEDLAPSAARIERVRAELKLREDQLRRTRQVFRERVVTEQEIVAREQAFIAAQADLTEAEAEDAKLRAGAWDSDLAVAKAQVDSARQAVEQAHVEIERLEVRAPLDAQVLRVDVRPGEYVGAPPGKSLLVLGDVSRLHVRVDVDEHDLARFRPGMSGRGFVRGDSVHPLHLSFVRVEPYTEPKRSLTGADDERIDTRVLQVIYAIEDQPRTLYVGQQIDVFLDEAP